MSVESMSKALQVQGLAPAEKLLLVGIANHDGDGGAWPSVRTLATYVGVSERQVQKLMARLILTGYVTREVNGGGTPRTPAAVRPNLYHLDFTRCPGGHPSPVLGDTPPPVLEDTPPPSWRTPEPSINRPGEPSVELGGDVPSPPRDRDPVLIKACPACNAPAGTECERTRQQADDKGRHLVRVSGAIVDRWYDHFRNLNGHPPSAPSWIAMKGLCTTALRAGHDPNRVYAAIRDLYADARPINGQTVDEKLTGRAAPPRPGRNAGTYGDRDVERVLDGDVGCVDPLAEFRAARAARAGVVNVVEVAG